MRDNNSGNSRMRQTTRHLMTAFIYSLAIASATGIALMLPLSNGHAVLATLVAHLVSGVLAFIFFVPYLFIHLREGRLPLAKGAISVQYPPRHRLFGHLLAWSTGLAMISGWIIASPGLFYLTGHPITLPLGTNAILVLAHLGACLPILVFLVLHFQRKDKS